jgi:hypothetical protein
MGIGWNARQRTLLGRALLTNKSLFAGLVFDEFDHVLETGYVGEDPVYIIYDAGFKKHIPAEKIDKIVLNEIKKAIQGQENFLSEQAAKMMGTEDVFSKALIENQLKNIDKQFEPLLQSGIPDDLRAYLGMSGFKVTVDYHGDLLELQSGGKNVGED